MNKPTKMNESQPVETLTAAEAVEQLKQIYDRSVAALQEDLQA